VTTDAWSQAVHTIALSGQHATGTTGNVSFDGFGVPQITAAGQAVFIGELRGDGIGCTPNRTLCNTTGLWAGGAGSLALVVRGGDTAPGLPVGVRFTAFALADENLRASSNGPLSFQAGAYAPDNTEYYGAWAGWTGTLQPAILSGDQAPGLPPELRISAFDGPGNFNVNSFGQQVLSARLRSTVNPADDSEGIWSSRSGTLQLVAHGGDHSPGMPADVSFSYVGNALLNSLGHLAFSAGLVGGGFNFGHDTSLWSDRSGSLALVASADQHAPGTDSGVVFQSVGSMRIDAADHIAFNGWLSGPGATPENARGIWSDVGGSLSPVVRAGEHAPGTPSGVSFSDFDEVLMSSSGKIAFNAHLIGGGPDWDYNDTVWSNSSGMLRLVARRGDALPGTNGIVIGGAGDAMINDAGQVAFPGSVLLPGDSYFYESLCAEDKAGVLHLVAREGGQIEVAPGDVRTIKSFDFVLGDSDGLNGDGSPLAFNGRGQITFSANFTDGTSGIFISDVAAVPEPNATTLLAAAVITLLATRYRFRGCDRPQCASV
jgi:hypothetical protein